MRAKKKKWFWLILIGEMKWCLEFYYLKSDDGIYYRPKIRRNPMMVVVKTAMLWIFYQMFCRVDEYLQVVIFHDAMMTQMLYFFYVWTRMILMMNLGFDYGRLVQIHFELS